VWRARDELATPTKTKNEMEGALLLDVIIRKRATVLQLLASEDKALLVGRDAFLVLDLRFYVVDGVGRLDLQRNGLAGERLDENLHATTQTENKVER